MTGCSKILKHSEQQNEKLTSSSREQTLGEEGQILVNNLIYLLETRNKLKNQQKHFIATDISYDDIIDCKEFHINSDPDKLMNGEVEMSEGASRGCTAIEEARQNLENLFPRLHDTCSDLYKTCPSVNLDGCLRHQYLPYLVDSYAIILYANSTQEYTRTPETSFYDLLPDFFSSQCNIIADTFYNIFSNNFKNKNSASSIETALIQSNLFKQAIDANVVITLQDALRAFKFYYAYMKLIVTLSKFKDEIDDKEKYTQLADNFKLEQCLDNVDNNLRITIKKFLSVFSMMAGINNGCYDESLIID